MGASVCINRTRPDADKSDVAHAKCSRKGEKDRKTAVLNVSPLSQSSLLYDCQPGELGRRMCPLCARSMHRKNACRDLKALRNSTSILIRRNPAPTTHDPVLDNLDYGFAFGDDLVAEANVSSSSSSSVVSLIRSKTMKRTGLGSLAEFVAARPDAAAGGNRGSTPHSAACSAHNRKAGTTQGAGTRQRDHPGKPKRARERHQNKL